MQRELIAVPEHWNIGQVIDYLRAGEGLTTDFWEVFVVDPQHHPVGTVQLSWILRTPRHIAMADLMRREQTLVPVAMAPESSEERRVGEDSVSTCRYRWSPCQYNKKT